MATGLEAKPSWDQAFRATLCLFYNVIHVLARSAFAVLR